MSLVLDPTERRIVGSLIEKDLTVPEAYPLTLNALVLACNQKSNRDPETAYEEHHVVGALRSLMERGWVQEIERAGSRVRRYAHDGAGMLGVDRAGLALLAELLLRGPQSAVELRTRASRMAPLGSVEEVERRLEALATRPVPYVRFLGKRPGERVGRFTDLLGTPAASTAKATGGGDEAGAPRPPARDSAGDASGDDVSVTPSLPASDLRARVEALERAVAELRARLDR
jgi:uncharacterized protein YceH (UPF0502 family)